MLKKFTFLFLEFLAGLAGNLIAGWIQQDHWSNIFTFERMAATVFCASVVIVLLAWLDSENSRLVSLNWHRYWYLLDLRKRFNSSFDKLQYAPLNFKIFPSSAEKITDIEKEVIVDENDIVVMLSSLLTSKKVKAKRYLILGNVGIGKTTVIRQLSFRLAEQSIRKLGMNQMFPIIIELGNYNGEDFLDFIYRRLTTQGKHGKALAIILHKLLEKGNVLLLFDAFDEAIGIHQGKISQEIADFLSNPIYQQTPIILTSRTQEGQNFILKDLVTFEILELGDSELESFINIYKNPNDSIDEIRNWFYSHQMLEKKGIARNPFWLRLFLLSGSIHHNEKINLLEGDSGSFLNRSINQLLMREWDTKMKANRSWQRLLPREEQITETKNALSYIAYWMGNNGKYIPIDKQSVIEELSKWLCDRIGLSILRPQDIIGFGHDAQIIKFESELIGYQHRLLQESLIAWYFIKNQQILYKEDKLLHYIENSDWWETIILMGEILSNDDPDNYEKLILTIVNSKADGRRLILAMGLLQCKNSLNEKDRVNVINALNQCFVLGLTEELKQAAIDLAKVLNGKKIYFLENMLLQSTGAEVLAIFQILGVIKNDYTINLLISHLKSPCYSTYATSALGSTGAIAVDPLLRVIRDKVTVTDIPVINSLGLIGDNRAKTKLLTILQHDNIQIRASACYALQKIGPGAVEGLCLLLRDERVEISVAAAEALTGMGHEPVKYLEKNLKNYESFNVQVLSIWILWQLGEVSAKLISSILEGFEVNSYKRTNNDNLPMRVLGAMIPVYRRSPVLIKQVWGELSPKASDLVGRVLLKRNWAEIRIKMIVEYIDRHAHDEFLGTALAVAASTPDSDYDGTFLDRAIYEYASYQALNFAYEITDYSNKIKAALEKDVSDPSLSK